MIETSHCDRDGFLKLTPRPLLLMRLRRTQGTGLIPPLRIDRFDLRSGVRWKSTADVKLRLPILCTDGDLVDSQTRIVDIGLQHLHCTRVWLEGMNLCPRKKLEKGRSMSAMMRADFQNHLCICANQIGNKFTRDLFVRDRRDWLTHRRATGIPGAVLGVSDAVFLDP